MKRVQSSRLRGEAEGRGGDRGSREQTGLRWRSEAKPFENQARDGARRSEAKSSVGEEIGAPAGVNNGEPRSERVKSIWSGFTNEKGFRGEHFEQISGL